jgi:predicted NUDIX family NTP pyrophosphohydrolase
MGGFETRPYVGQCSSVPTFSAGLLLFRRHAGAVEVLLVHPGGPFWQKKDLAAWSIPKGEHDAGEDPLSAAQREFEEETGFKAEGDFIALGDCRQPSGKIVKAWAVEGDLDAARITSNSFSLEWPPKSGKMREFPEVDRAEWFSIDVAREKILKGQAGFLDRLLAKLQP